jgi:hypothetical protein
MLSAYQAEEEGGGGVGAPGVGAPAEVGRASWGDRWWYRDYLRRVAEGPIGQAGERLIGAPARHGVLTVYRGASLVEASMPTIGQRGVPGSKRGAVSAYSAASRRRLLRVIGKLRKDVLPLFVTLTYPGAWDVRSERWKRDLQAFWKRVRREWPTASCVWRLEFQRRGAPHFHLLLYGVPIEGILAPWADGSRWVDKAWFEVVGSGDLRHQAAGCRVEPVRSLEGTFFYAAKYLSKTGLPDGGASAAFVGRFWGIMGRQFLPWGAKMVYIMLGSEAWSIRRALLRCLGLRGRGRKGCSMFGVPERWELYLSRLRGVELDVLGWGVDGF